MKKQRQAKKLVVNTETIRDLRRDRELVAVAAGMRRETAGSHQDACCA